ncbi:MAG TPA: hypothetical protein VFJ73_00385 [Bacillales bacterium]|nr:hypothetical protein [Bacillales bacterium]
MSTGPWILLVAMLVVSIGEVMYVPVKEAYLADIAPERARSSYMAVNSISGYGAMFIAAVFVTLGGVLPYWIIAGMFLVMGFSGIMLFQKIIPALNEQKMQAKETSTL